MRPAYAGATWLERPMMGRTASAAPVLLPDIPRLREKEEERKGTGAPWYLGSGSDAGFLVGGEGAVRVGSTLAMRGGLLARMAAVLAELFGGPTTLLGRLFASATGRWLVGAGLAVWAALLLGAAARFYGWGAAPAPALPEFKGMDAPGVVIKAPVDRSLGYVETANEGEILWESAKPSTMGGAKDAGGPATPPAPPAQEKPSEVPPFQMPDARQLMGDALNRGGFVPRLTSDLGSLRGVGPATSGVPRLRDAGGFALTKTFAAPGLGKSERGSLGGMQRARRALTNSRLNGMRGMATRAAGQLKLANAMSVLGATAESDQAAHTYAADAFDQGKSIGGGLAGLPGGDGIVVPPGTGAPDGVTPAPPDVPPATNLTPYQPQVDNAKGLGDQAAALKNEGMMMLMMGAMLLAIGIGLLAAGAALMAAPPPMNLIGIALMAAGAALVAAGAGLMSAGEDMLNQAQQMAQQAQNQGQNINQQYGQPDQGNIVGQCAQFSANTGAPVDACPAQNPAQNQQAHQNVQQAVAAEQNTGFTLTPAAGGGAAPGNVRQGAADPALAGH